MRLKKSYFEEIKEYLKKNLKKGYTKESLRQALLDQGNSKLEVERAIKSIDKELAKEAPVLKTRPEIKYEIVEPKGYIPQKESFFNSLLRKLGL